MSGGPLPKAVHRLSITSVLVAAIGFFISISHLGVYSHYFTICASVATFIYWMVLSMRSSRRCISDVEEEEPTHDTAMHHAGSIDSQTVVYRPPTPSVQPSIDGYANHPRRSRSREDSRGSSRSIPYPSQTIHSLNLFVSFALAAAWSGGSWIPIVSGLGGEPETVFLTVFEGVVGYIDAVIMWAIFLLCLRARVRRARNKESIGMHP